MKKVYEWFEYLPPTIRDKAQAYFFESFFVVEYDFECGSLWQALCCGFVWIDTEERQLYWENIAKKYKSLKP